MAEIKVINLKDHVPGGASIEFLRAEVPAQDRIPFVLIRYSLGGVEQKYGLRLDLGKQAFIDHFDDDAKERVLNRTAPTISAFLGSMLPQGHEGSITIRLFGNQYGVSFAPHWGHGAIGIRYCHDDKDLTEFLNQLGIFPQYIDKTLQDLQREGHALIPNVRLSPEEINRHGL